MNAPTARLGGLLALALCAPALAQDPSPTPAPASPTPAPAQAASKLALTLTAKQAEVALGSSIELEVKLTNTSDQPIGLIELRQARQSLSFDVQIDDGEVFVYERIYGETPLSPKTWPEKELAAGESWTLAGQDAVRLVAVTSGTWTVQAHYARPPRTVRSPPEQAFASPPPTPVPHAESEAIKVEVTPSPKGETELRLVMITQVGPIRVRLYPKDALGTCLNMAALVKYGAKVGGKLKQPFYDGLSFHRLAKNYGVVQGGCPNGDGTGGPGWMIPSELPQVPAADLPKRLRHQRGALAMARSNHPDSAGSQFYLLFEPAPYFDRSYVVFGQMESGFDALDTLAATETTARTANADPDIPVGKLTIRTVALEPVKR